MNKIYDNGEKIIGSRKQLKKYFEDGLNNCGEEIDIDFCKDVLMDLKDLQDSTIVYINYDCGMGYQLYYWEEKDIIKEN